MKHISLVLLLLCGCSPTTTDQHVVWENGHAYMITTKKVVVQVSKEHHPKCGCNR